jgi:hypothetical protein
MLIEINTFRLADGVSDDVYLAADERVRTGFVYHQPGIVRSTTCRAENGEWAVILFWASDEEADSAAAKVGDSPEYRELGGLIDQSTLQQRRYTTFD